MVSFFTFFLLVKLKGGLEAALRGSYIARLRSRPMEGCGNRMKGCRRGMGRLFFVVGLPVSISKAEVQ